MAPNDTEDLRETKLSPEVRRIRNSIIKKFADEPLDIMAKFVKDVVENEQDTVKRLGAMAARVEILRMRISQISDSGNSANFDSITEEDTIEHKLEEENSEIVITSPNLSDWVRLRIIENSEINGVRFPKGVVIDVSQEDGDRLLESGKASYIEEDEIADVKSDINLNKKIESKSSKSPTGETDVMNNDSSDIEDETSKLPQKKFVNDVPSQEVDVEEKVGDLEFEGKDPEKESLDPEDTNSVTSDEQNKNSKIENSENSSEKISSNDESNQPSTDPIEENEETKITKKKSKAKIKMVDKEGSLGSSDSETASEEKDFKNDEEKESVDAMIAGFDLEEGSKKDKA